MEKEFDYKQDLAIDPSELDEECLLQASLYMKYGEKLANAKKARDLAHEKVKVTRSRLIRAAMKNQSNSLDVQLKLRRTQL